MLFLGQAIGHVNGQLPAQGTCDNLKATSPHQQQKSVLNLYFWYSKIVQYFFQVMLCLVCCLCQVQAAWKGSCLEVSDLRTCWLLRTRRCATRAFQRLPLAGDLRSWMCPQRSSICCGGWLAEHEMTFHADSWVWSLICGDSNFGHHCQRFDTHWPARRALQKKNWPLPSFSKHVAMIPFSPPGISIFIPEDYYVASLLANFLRGPKNGQLACRYFEIYPWKLLCGLLANFLRGPKHGQFACQFFPNHFKKYFEIYPRRLLCGQLACHFSGFLYMASLLAYFFPNHFMKYFEIYPRRFIIWPACLPFSISANWSQKVMWPACWWNQCSFSLFPKRLCGQLVCHFFIVTPP